GDREDPAHAELLAGMLSEALDPIVRSDLPLVIDAAEHLTSGDPRVRVIEALCRQAPPLVHVVLASRSALPAQIQRAAGAPLGPSEFAFSVEETTAFLSAT